MTNKTMYDNEPWAKVARAAGFEPVDTESAARMAFRLCAAKIDEQQAELERQQARCAEMEGALREIARTNCAGYILRGKEECSELRDLISEFYGEFRKRVDIAKKALAALKEDNAE